LELANHRQAVGVAQEPHGLTTPDAAFDGGSRQPMRPELEPTARSGSNLGILRMARGGSTPPLERHRISNRTPTRDVTSSNGNLSARRKGLARPDATPMIDVWLM